MRIKINAYMHLLIPALLLTAQPVNSAEQNKPAQWVLPAVQAPRLQYRTFDSTAAGTNVSFQIYTPEIYDTETARRFPVLYWLHGTGGGTKGLPWLVNYFDSAIRSGEIPPMLVVFPNGLESSMWCDSKDGTVPMETIVIKELIPLVDSTFRTVAAREGRIIEGFSMGGYGAGRLGLKYHHLFCAISMLAAGPLHPDFVTRRAKPSERDQLLKTVYGDDMNYFKVQSPWQLAEKNAGSVRTGMLFRVVIGDRDSTLDFSRGFSEQLTQLDIPHTFTVLPGVDHDPRATLQTLGKDNWQFYQKAFSGINSGRQKEETP